MNGFVPRSFVPTTSGEEAFVAREVADQADAPGGEEEKDSAGGFDELGGGE